jgi:hypothetical protein
VVIEGLVAPPGGAIDYNYQFPHTRGQNATVAIEDPPVGPAGFIVAWESDIFNLTGPQPAQYDEIHACRFSAAGQCLPWGTPQTFGPKALSDHFLPPPGGQQEGKAGQVRLCNG